MRQNEIQEPRLADPQAGQAYGTMPKKKRGSAMLSIIYRDVKI